MMQIRSLTTLLLVALAVPSHEQSTPISPCPNVFIYESTRKVPGRWYGVINLSTDSTLHSLWLDVVLDNKADMLGNWVGDVTTTDNMDFKVENTKMKIHPGPARPVRFFVQYNPLNKTPRLQTIRLNGREICNAKFPQPTLDIPDADGNQNSRPSRPESTTRPNKPTRPDDRTETIKPEDRPHTRPVAGNPSGDGPVYVPTQNPPIDQSNVNPYSIGGGSNAQNVGTQTERRTTRPPYQATTSVPFRTTTKRRVMEPEDFDSDSDSRPDMSEYFSGGQLTFIVPSTSGGGSLSSDNFFNNNGNGERNRPPSECGTVTKNNPNPLIVNGKPTLEGQWPWQIALYQAQTVENKYICGGTLVSRQFVITAAHCITKKGSNRIVNKNTLIVYLGKHNLRTSVDGVQIRLVAEIMVHPQYNASAYSRDLGILKFREAVNFTDWVRPACLWPDNGVDLTNVIGKKGAVVGWGFDNTGVATEELTLVEMPVVDRETCIRSYSEFFARFTSEYTYCAGYRDGTSVCNGDSGGGMVFYENRRWYLRGLVSLSVARKNEYRCDPTLYVVFTDLAKFLPWIRDIVGF